MKELKKFKPGNDYTFEELEEAIEKTCCHYGTINDNKIGLEVFQIINDEGDGVTFILTSATFSAYYYTCVYNEFTIPKFIRKK